VIPLDCLFGAEPITEGENDAYPQANDLCGLVVWRVLPMNQRRGPHLVDCEFSWAFDDRINIHGFINLVIEKHDSDHLLLAGPFERHFDVGDTLKFYRYPDTVPAGQAVVTEITPVTEPSRKEVERRGTSFFTATNKHNPVRSFPGSQPSLVKHGTRSRSTASRSMPSGASRPICRRCSRASRPGGSGRRSG
jgi:hypothetical protein